MSKFKEGDVVRYIPTGEIINLFRSGSNVYNSISTLSNGYEVSFSSDRVEWLPTGERVLEHAYDKLFDE